MQFWFSGEVDQQVHDEYRVIRQEIERILNAELSQKGYGDALAKIAIVPMILGPEFVEGRTERRLIKRAEKVADYRLFIDFEAWLKGSNEDKRTLLVENVLTAVDDIARKITKDFDGAALRSDIIRIFPRIANKTMEPTR